MPDDWTPVEVEATVADYFDMLECEILGREYNKSAHRRRLSSTLNGRSDGAIERKHQNISAILIELGFVYVQGYKPLGNYQRLLFDVVSGRLEKALALHEALGRRIAEPAAVPALKSILGVLVDPPHPRPIPDAGRSGEVRDRPRVLLRLDYAALEARNRSLGAAGEEFVLRYEVARLARAGETRLSRKVERVSETRGDALGYDVLSYEVSGLERFIEVKTTGYGPYTPFFITRNELATSRSVRDRYHLYRAFGFRRQPRLFMLPGALDSALRLEATEYIARLA